MLSKQLFNTLLPFLNYVQIVVLIFSFYICKIFKKLYSPVKYVFGTYEIANILENLSSTFENSKVVCFYRNRFYSKNNYDYEIYFNNIYLRVLIIFIYGPLLLGFLMNKSEIFFYIWNKGFLFNRKYEFYFLKKKKKKLILFYCGSDIRSPTLSLNYTDSKGIDNHLNYLDKNTNTIVDKKVKIEASLADQYADLIFSAKLDQISYIKKEIHIPPYSYPKSKFNSNTEKFNFETPILIVHAPSSPIFKGTQLVRAAIKKLELQGYDFEYIELINKPNEEVLSILSRSHIVLNQFYGHGEGIGSLGVEAMANMNCLVMSLDDNYSYENVKINDVIFNTKYWEIDEKLKFLLDHPHEIKKMAVAGYDFTLNNFESEKAKFTYQKIFKNIS
jgi:hypothetical protein